MTARPSARSRPSRRSTSPTRSGKRGQQIESFQIGDEEDGGDGTKQFVVKLTMKKAKAGQDVRYFVHGRDPVWVFSEADYKQMLEHGR